MVSISFPQRLETVIPAWRRPILAATALGLSSAGVLLAALSACAGAIHLVMVPSHMGEWVPEGTGFAIAGWAQIALAFLFLTRPSRAALAITIVLNAGLIGVWALTRTAGLPAGPHAGHPEAVTFIDLSCVIMEGGLIACALALFAWPTIGAGWSEPWRILSIVASLAVLAVTTMALASPSARNHAEHSHGTVAGDRGLSVITNGHHHAIKQEKLDASTQAALDVQLNATHEVAALYPTVKDAEAAGYRRAGPYFPGIGAHYIKYGGEELNADGVIDGDDAKHPLALIYDGTEPGAQIAGFMFYSISKDEPQGFAGPNDVWHYHENLCLKFGENGVIDAPYGPDKSATDAQCAAVGGRIIKSTQWMVHVWSVPGWDRVDGGVFAEVNQGLDCSDGTYYQLPVEQWASHLMNVCRSSPR